MQYNTCFWALVKSGKSRAEANQALQVRLGRACEGHCLLGLHLQKFGLAECAVLPAWLYLSRH